MIASLTSLLSLASLVRITLVLGLSLAAMPLLRGRSAVARRLVLSVAFASVLLLPFVPAWRVTAPGVSSVVGRLAGRVVAEPSLAGAAAAPSPGVSTVASSGAWGDVLLLAWALGALLVAGRFLVGLLTVRRIAVRATPVPSAWALAVDHAARLTGRRAVVRVSSEITSPALAGLLSPMVLVPPSSMAWTEERKVTVLLHELAHVAAHDLGVSALATTACALYWFHPLAWLSARRLRLERELAADEAVLRSGVRPSSYAADLLAIAGRAPAGSVAIASRPLATRITAIVAARRPSSLGPVSASALVVGSATIGLAVAACTATATDHGAPVTAPDRATTAREPRTGERPADGELQTLADRELAEVGSEWRATGGTILVMSPKGEVLADAGGRTDRPYVTGSTLKPLLLAAALEQGVVTESDVFDCGVTERSGKALRDASPLGRVGLAEMLARSSNVGFAQIFDRMGGATTDRALQRFRLSPPEELAVASPGDLRGALVAIGATMTATPRQIALAYAALADGGGGIVSPTTAARTTTLLEGVVAADHGTGKKARVAGVRVAGKTGSSEWTAGDGTRRTYASFVGYVPADRPRFVVFVGVESPSGDEPWGGSVAGPVFARLASRALSR